MKPGLWSYRVVEESCDWSPNVESSINLLELFRAEDRYELCDESFPGEDEPLGVEEKEPAQEREEDGPSEPVPGEEWQGLEPVLDISPSAGHLVVWNEGSV